MTKEEEFDKQSIDLMQEQMTVIHGEPLTVGINATLNLLENLISQSPPDLQEKAIIAASDVLTRIANSLKEEQDLIH